MALYVDQIEEQVAARVAAIDSTPYDQRAAGTSATAPTFTESAAPLVPQGESRALSHLRFQVLAESAEIDTDRQTPGTDAHVISAVSVTFLYHLRPGYQRADQRTAARAAADIVRAVKAHPQSEWSALVTSAWAPVISADGEWLLVSVSFLIDYDMPV